MQKNYHIGVIKGAIKALEKAEKAVNANAIDKSQYAHLAKDDLALKLENARANMKNALIAGARDFGEIQKPIIV